MISKYRYMAIGLLGSVAMLGTPASAVSDQYQLKMWIAPLECTRNEISDGVTTTVILTPEQCEDILHPPVGPTKPVKPTKPTRQTPAAPDTGRFSDIWTTITMSIILAVFGVSIAALTVNDIRRLRTKRLQKK